VKHPAIYGACGGILIVAMRFVTEPFPVGLIVALNSAAVLRRVPKTG
jgi:hypothetical protein